MVQSLISAFVLGYHGCDAAVAEQVLRGRNFRHSNNDYDWLGGVYFWEANPRRGLEWARELKRRGRGRIDKPPWSARWSRSAVVSTSPAPPEPPRFGKPMNPIYDGAGFQERTHIQICVRNLSRIKGVFRVPRAHMD